jgi:hypothetical protein
MPAVSQAQRRLMFAAAAKKGGVGGVSQTVGKEFADADQGGKLPENIGDAAKKKANHRYRKRE